MNILKKLVLKPTIRCFHNCLYCRDRQTFYNKDIKNKSYDASYDSQGMPLSILLQVAKDGYELGMRECLLSGGDPLLYPYLPQLISGIKQISREIFVFMNSVGWGLNQENALKILDAGLGAWNFSVDTINEHKHDYIRGSKGALKQTLKAFDLLRKLRITHFQDKPFWINFMTVLTQQNYTSLPELFEFCIKEGVSSIFLMHVYGDQKQKRFLLNENQVCKWRNEIVPEIISILSSSQLDTTVKQNAESVLYSFFPEDLPTKYYTDGCWWENLEQCHNICNIPEYYALLEEDGTLLPCCLVEVAHKGIVGNIYNESLTSIWCGNKYEQFRKMKLDFCIFCSAPRHKTIGLVPELCRQFG